MSHRQYDHMLTGSFTGTVKAQLPYIYMWSIVYKVWQNLDTNTDRIKTDKRKKTSSFMENGKNVMILPSFLSLLQNF